MSGSSGFWSLIKRALRGWLGFTAPKRVDAVPEAPHQGIAPASEEPPIVADAAPDRARSFQLAGMLAVTAKLNLRKGKRARSSKAGRAGNRPVRASGRAAKRSTSRPVWIGGGARQRAVTQAKPSTVVPFRGKPAAAVRPADGRSSLVAARQAA